MLEGSERGFVSFSGIGGIIRIPEVSECLANRYTQTKNINT
jgi:hypothetical protein